MITIFLVLFFAIVIVTLLFEIWMPLRSPSPAKTHILNGSFIIVKEIKSFFHKTVIVNLDEESFNSIHSNTSINFYGAYGSCDGKNVELINKSIVLTEKNISNYIPQYFALQGSFFEYKVSVNSTSHANIVNVCVDGGFDYIDGQCKRLLLGQDRIYRYPVLAPGYYFFRVESRVDYKLSINETLRILSINQDDALGCSINTTNTVCQFDLPLKPKYCLMARLYQPAIISDIKLDVQVTESRYDIMLGTPLSVLVLLITLFVLFIVCVPPCYLKFCITRKSRVV